MKAVIGKSKICHDKFLNSLDIKKEEITDKKIIAETLNKFFINIVYNLTDKIRPSSTNVESYLPNITAVLSDKLLSQEEFKDAFFILKTNKSPGHDNLHVNVIRSMYHEFKIPLMNSFSQSLSTRPVYRPISVFPCFPKILERVMYNRLYSYLTENIILFNKKFGFRAGHYALLELVDQISNPFNDKSYLLGIFIGL